MSNNPLKTIILPPEEQSAILKNLTDIDLKGLDDRVTTAIRIVSCAFELASNGLGFSSDDLLDRVNKIALSDDPA